MKVPLLIFGLHSNSIINLSFLSHELNAHKSNFITAITQSSLTFLIFLTIDAKSHKRQKTWSIINATFYDSIIDLQ